MKPSNFSSSGELSESQGLNDFLNAHSTRDEATALNKNRPQPAFMQSMNPRHADLMNYYPPSSIPNNYGMPMGYQGMMNPGYDYEDEDFEEYADMEYEEERDPYDFEIDFGPAKKKNQAKILNKSYEERKKALEKKRDQKKKSKEEEIKKKEEEEKRLKIEAAIQKEQSKSKKSLFEEKRLSTKNNEKISFDIADALNESKSHKTESLEKSQEPEEEEEEDYQEKKPEVYDPTEMMKYMGKSSLIASQSQSQSQIPDKNNTLGEKTEENESEIKNNNTFENTSKFTNTNNNVSEKFTTNNNISEKFTAKNASENYNPSKIDSDVYDASQTNEYLKKNLDDQVYKENIPKLQVSTPISGLEALIKTNNIEKFSDVQEKGKETPKAYENNSFLKPNNTNPLETTGKQESFNTFAGDNSIKTAKTPEIPETSLRFTEIPQKPMNKVGDMMENKLFEMKLGHKTEELDDANKRIEGYQTELEEIVRQLEVSERKVLQLELENKNLRFSSESKMRVMQEKAVFIDKITETRLTQQLNEQFYLEKEGLLLEIEKLNNEISYFKSQNEAFFQSKREVKTLESRRQALEGENAQLKRELLEYQELIKDPIVQRRAIRKTSQKLLDSDEDNDFLREFEFQELLIKGYQKENERNLLLIKDLKEEIANLTGKVFKKETAIVDLKGKVARSQKAGLLIENSKIDVMKGMVSPDVLVDMEDLKDLRRRLVENIEENKVLKGEIELERREKMDIEEKLREIRENMEKNEKMKREFEGKERKYEEIKGKLEGEIKRLEGEILRLEKEGEEYKKNINDLKRESQENKRELLEKTRIFEENAKKIKLHEKEDISIKKENNEVLKNKNSIVNQKKGVSASVKGKITRKNPIGSNNNKVSEVIIKGKKSNQEPLPMKDEQNNDDKDSLMVSDKNLLRFLENNGSEIYLQGFFIIKNLNISSENMGNLLRELQLLTLDFPIEFEAFKLRLRSLNFSLDKIEEIYIFELKSLYEEAFLSLLKQEKPFITSPPIRKIDNFMKNNENSEKVLKKLELENKDLKDLIMNTPKNPTRLDFEILERKLELVERGYKQKELEILGILENLKNPYKAANAETQALKLEAISVRNQLERERKEYEENLKRKNWEIEGFKQELNELLGEIEMLKS